MTQIQAYENMSKEALIEHHKHTLQQHADDMDMLSKELASRTFVVPDGWQLLPIQATKEMKLAFHKANEEYQEGTNYDLLSPSHQWAAMLDAAPSNPATEKSSVVAITPADAVYGLLAWLTCREEVVALSARHGAAIACDLAKAFCEENGLLEFSDGYPDNLKYPDSSLEQEA